MKSNCQTCGKEFTHYGTRKARYCSAACFGVSEQAKVDEPGIVKAYTDGRTIEETAAFCGTTPKVVYRILKKHNVARRAARVRAPKFAEEHPRWLGTKAGYVAMHDRVERRRGKPKSCEKCGTADPKLRYEWANVNGGNFSDVNGFKRMCVKCHRAYDAKQRTKKKP